MRNERQTFIKGLRRANLEAQGVWTCRILKFEDMEELVSLACMGDQTARQIMHLALSAVTKMNKARRTLRPALCLLCDHEFNGKSSPPTGLVILMAYGDAAETGIVNALCHQCFNVDQDELMSRILAVYKDQLMGGKIRVLDPIGDPGHA